ncbi:MAG: hypothetical protein DI539_18610 [Flavobacterium psychrophilum]|nr:MAG: hypothetical protein DI539_18610 [Flavobacterium psychrophilum]
MKSNIFLIFFLLIGANIRVIAQQTINMAPPSPDAASLGVYGNVPVSTYTGVPNINIPLYDISYRDVQIPINLSYHSAGVTLEQDAGWVGLNWSLNVGGIITRTIKGGDDMQFANDGYSNEGVGGIGYQGYPYDPGETSGSYLYNICQKNIDAEPDVFYFNFFGKSGSFALQRGQNPSQNYVVGTSMKVEKIDIKYDKAARRWQIKTTDGYTYYFGTIEATETLHGVGKYGKGPEFITFDQLSHGFLSYEDIVVSAWYLDKIITPTGEEINYIYDVVTQGNRKISYYGSARISINDLQEVTVTPNQANECYIPPIQTSGNKIFTSHVYLKEIQHPSGKIIFGKSLREDMMPATSLSNTYYYLMQSPWYLHWLQQGPQKLDNITIQDANGNTVKRFELEYDYFNAQVTGFEKYHFRRLKLKRVRECGTQECKPWYQLFYNETYPLPSKYSNAQDFWGYYNGAHNNISRVPYGTYYNWSLNKYFYLGDSDRQPNPAYMTSGILTKIIYPTGGWSDFEFEPHDYYGFGNDAFTITDFENNKPIPLADVVTTEDGPAFKTITFTITDPVQEVIIDGQMTYYASATSSDPCNVAYPPYVGSEPWYSLKNVSSSSNITAHFMSDFLSYFDANLANNCPNNPSAIEPIYRSRETIVLNAGTYELKVHAREEFNIYMVVSKSLIHPRVVSLNQQGVYAKVAGGLRIKKITHRDNLTAVPQVKKYDYTVTVQGQKYSTGKLMLFPNYHIPHYCSDDISGQLVMSMMGRSWSNTPLGTSAAGSIVGYDQVIEWNGENNENGRTEYYFYNQVEEPIESMYILEGLPTRVRSSNGLTSDVKQFDAAGNPVKTENFIYASQLQTHFPAMAAKQLIIESWGIVYGACNQNLMLAQEYSIVSDRWVPTTKTEVQYGQQSSGTLQTVTTYEYDTQTHLQLKSEQTTLANGDIIKTDYKYPSEASWIPTAMWQDKFMYAKPVEQKLYKNSNLKNTYKASYSAQANTFLLNKEEGAVGAANLETMNEYTYTGKGNIRTVKSRTNPTTIYIWGYDHNYPVAQIKNTTLPQVLVALGNISETDLNTFEGQGTPSVDYLSRIANLRINLPNAQIDNYTYQPYVGMRTATAPNGITIYYEYDNYGRLVTIKDHDQKVIKKLEYKYQSQ